MLHSLAYTTNPSISVAVRATTGAAAANLVPSAAARYSAQGVQFQALVGNSGYVYICDRANPNLTTGAGVLYRIGPPAANASPPGWSVANPAGVETLNLNELYILPTIADEGVSVAALRT